MSKRYFVFAGDYYYPAGGAEDLIHSTDTVDNAIAKANFVVKSMENDWAHVFDTESGNIVFEKNK